MNIQRNVVTTLKMIQAQNKLSLEEFAKSMGVGRSSLQEYMAEKRSPRLDTLELMANKLKVPILSFVSGKLTLDIWSDTKERMGTFRDRKSVV